MSSHDFATADKFGKMVGLFWPLVLEFGSFFAFSGLDLALGRKQISQPWWQLS